MTNSSQQSWLRAIAEAAKEQDVSLPAFTGHGMGSACSRSNAGGRFITFKRRLVPAAQAAVDGIEWALWLEQDGLPVRVVAFREPQEPRPENVKATLSLLKGWLVDGWTPEEAKTTVRAHPLAQPVDKLPLPSGDNAQKRARIHAGGSDPGLSDRPRRLSAVTRSEGHWAELGDELARFADQEQEWQHPWLATSGDVVFSVWSPEHRLGVMVIQSDPRALAEGGVSYRFDIIGDKRSEEVHTLIINCDLSKRAAYLTRDLMLSWMQHGKVSISRPEPSLLLDAGVSSRPDQEGPLVVGNPWEDWLSENAEMEPEPLPV